MTRENMSRYSSCACILQPASHLLSRRKSWMLSDHASIPEDDEARDRLDAKSRAQPRLSFRIDLQDKCATRHVSRKFVHDRGRRAARTTP